MTAYVLLIGGAILALPTWAFVGATRARSVVAAVLGLALVCTIIAGLLGDEIPADGQAVATIFAAALCVAGGSVVTVAIFDSIDRDEDLTEPDGQPLADGPTPGADTFPPSVDGLTPGANTFPPQVDPGPDSPGDRSRQSMSSAGRVLRGGAWIGGLERIAVFVALLAGSPEGVAVVLAIKGLGRYPELGRDTRTATAQAVGERFIIGTMASFVWAAGCALAISLSH